MADTRSKIAVAIALAALLLAPGSAQAADWTTYRNEQFGFSLEYPAQLFAPEASTEAGDGQSFINQKSGARLLVGVLPNDSNFTPRTYQEYLARSTYKGAQIQYRKRGNSWMVLSGSNSDSIFYEKALFSCGGRSLSSFIVTYPIAERSTYDAVVERAEKTFRGATRCDPGGRVARKAGTPRQEADVPKTTAGPRHKISTQNEARLAGQSRRSLPGKHSALADRIARQRGNDVIVILRRTVPPYDRVVQHGFASRQ
jgi:hypothetical protein